MERLYETQNMRAYSKPGLYQLCKFCVSYFYYVLVYGKCELYHFPCYDILWWKAVV
jgi:hypothetical protein